MTDEITTPIATTADAPEITKLPTGGKPYDDEVFDSYAEETPAKEEGSDDGPSVGSPDEGQPDATADKEAEPEEKTEEAKSKKGDQVDDGFEKVPVKKIINGKEVEFTVKQAIDAFVKQEDFNRKMDQRLSHISNREKQVQGKEQRWQEDQTNFKSKLDKVIDVAQRGDFITSIRALAKLAAGDSGLDVVQFEKQYFDQLDKVRELYTKMTPEQREAYFAKRAAAEAQSKAKKLEEKEETRSSREQLAQHVSGLQKQYEVPEQEFWEHFKEMSEKLTGEGKPFKTANDIQPEHVISKVLEVRHWAKIFEAGEKVQVKDEAVLDAVFEITAKEPNLTIDEIAKLIEDAGLASKTASPQAVENLNRKVEKSKSRPSSPASSTKKENGKLEGLDDEDINFLYRNKPKVYSRPAR